MGTAVFPVRMDRMVTLYGVFSAGTTTFTLPFADNTLTAGVLPSGSVITLARPTTTTATIAGDYSGQPVVIGRPFNMDVRISRQFIRSGGGLADIRSSLLLRRACFYHRRSGDYFVRYTRTFGGDITRTYNPTTIIDGDGEFEVGPLGKSNETTISFGSSSARPVVISAIQFDAVLAKQPL